MRYPNNSPVTALVKRNEGSDPMSRRGMADMQRAIAAGGAMVFDEEIAGLTQERLVPGVTRLGTVEDSAADYATVAPELYHKLAAMQLPAIIPVLGEYALVQSDFNLFANYELARAGFGVVEAVGRNDQTNYTPTISAADGLVLWENFSDPNLVAGFQIDWGVTLLNAAPFDMEIITQYWKDYAGWASVDRRLTVRASVAEGGMFGGTFQILFAQRLTTAQTCGYTGTSVAPGGMQKAIFQPGTIPCAIPGAFYTRLPPHFIESTLADATPTIQLNIPANIASAFSARLRLLTAGSPALAMCRDRLHLNGNGVE